MDLNGKTLKVNNEVNISECSLTIQGKGTLQAKEIKNFGSLTSTKGIGYAIKVDGGVLNISGGTVKYQKPANGQPANDYGWGPEVTEKPAIKQKLRFRRQYLI